MEIVTRHGAIILTKLRRNEQTSGLMFCDPHSPNDAEDEGDQDEDPEHHMERSISTITPTTQHAGKGLSISRDRKSGRGRTDEAM
jgi:hypothetical protein